MNSNRNLRKVVSADYDHLPLVTFDLGACQAVFPLPENSGTLNTQLAPSTPSLEEFQQIDPDNPTKEKCLPLISCLTWDCYSVGTGSWLGNLMLGVGIMDNRNGQFDFLDGHSFKKWMLFRAHEFYSEWNEGIREDFRRNNLDIIEGELFVYPQTENDISLVISNGTTWYREKTGSPKGASHISNSFRTPIDGKFSLNIEFQWSSAKETCEILESEIDDLQLEYLQKVRLIPNT
jgi:hypothetical protein